MNREKEFSLQLLEIIQWGKERQKNMVGIIWRDREDLSKSEREDSSIICSLYYNMCNHLYWQFVCSDFSHYPGAM